MNLYRIVKVNEDESEFVSGALTYLEAQKKVNELTRLARRSGDNDSQYVIRLYMPPRPANGISGLPYTD